jgi:hypothetical protein
MFVIDAKCGLLAAAPARSLVNCEERAVFETGDPESFFAGLIAFARPADFSAAVSVPREFHFGFVMFADTADHRASSHAATSRGSKRRTLPT